MPSTFWVHCSSKQSGKPHVLSRLGKILISYGASTSANLKNSSGIRTSAKSSLNSSLLIILHLNRQIPRRQCRNRERYATRILRKVIAMERLTEARGVQLKASVPSTTISVRRRWLRNTGDKESASTRWLPERSIRPC